MNSTTLPRINKVIDAGLNQPAINIILPFEPKMSPKSEIVSQIKLALEKVQEKVFTNHKDDLCALVMHKLRNLINNLNFSTYKQSIAIYVSPVFEKVLYLDIPVEPKVTINEPFDIRNLIVAKKTTRQYLILLLNEYCSNIYLGKDLKLTKIKANMPSNNIHLKGNAHRQQSLFANRGTPVEESLDKIVSSADQGLTALLQAYPLPVFVLGSRKILNYFKATTINKKRVLEYDHLGSETVSEGQLIGMMTPRINNWDGIQTKYLQQQLNIAMTSNKLAIGIGNVWKIASEGKGRLLVVEGNYRYAAQLLENEDGLYTSKETYQEYSHVRDAVDNIIEIVLENGGDVEFTDKSLPPGFKHIALIQY
jgi:hypothetical protein